MNRDYLHLPTVGGHSFEWFAEQGLLMLDGAQVHSGTGTQGPQGTQGVQGAQGGSGGGGSSGSPVVRKFPFAYNTPSILTGAALYTPTVDDVLLDLWIEIDTAWDGTTPFGDVGTFVDGSGGVFANGVSDANALDMTIPDSPLSDNTGLLQANQASDAMQTNLMGIDVPFMAEVSGIGPALTLVANPTQQGSRVFPCKVTAANPIKVVVSQDGTNTGMDPGSTQGAAILYLVTATPI